MVEEKREAVKDGHNGVHEKTAYHPQRHDKNKNLLE
jgi:hypothetical protein